MADVFDALASQRPYKDAVPFEEAIDVMRAERGRHCDAEAAARRMPFRAAGAGTDAPRPLADVS